MLCITIVRPFLGPQGCCRFTPTCTEYAQEQLTAERLDKALWNIIKRVLSCNPFF